jgi:hypothetical protein
VYSCLTFVSLNVNFFFYFICCWQEWRTTFKSITWTESNTSVHRTTQVRLHNGFFLFYLYIYIYNLYYFNSIFCLFSLHFLLPFLLSLYIYFFSLLSFSIIFFLLSSYCRDRWQRRKADRTLCSLLRKISINKTRLYSIVTRCFPSAL